MYSALVSGGVSNTWKLPERCELTPMLRAQPLDPSFTWRSHRERWTWRSIGLLLAIAAGAGFYAGRLSPAAPVPPQQPTALEQQTASAGSVAQSQGALQPDVAAAWIRSTTANADTKPAAKVETSASLTASSTETAKAQSTTATAKGSSSPPVLITNPSTAGKAVVGDAAKKPVSKTEVEAAAKANAKTETHKAADDAAPAAANAKRQAKSHSPPRSSVRTAPTRQDTVVARRDDAYVPRRDDAYVPPRFPQAAYADRRERYDDAESYYGRARLGQPYPDRRYAEDAPPPRTYYEDRREDLRPFQNSPDFREYRRFGGYDGDPYPDRRPVLRPMYGGPGY